MTNRTDLIAKLEALNPTQGEWKYDTRTRIINSFNQEFGILPIAEVFSRDASLITLAPTMRLEILAMAKEIDELEAQLETERNSIRLITKKTVDNIPQPKIQIVIACEKFKQPNPHNDYCMNCGKHIGLH